MFRRMKSHTILSDKKGGCALYPPNGLLNRKGFVWINPSGYIQVYPCDMQKGALCGFQE